MTVSMKDMMREIGSQWDTRGEKEIIKEIYEDIRRLSMR